MSDTKQDNLKSESDAGGSGAKKQVKQLYDLMKSENIQDLEIKKGKFYISLKRKSNKKAVVLQELSAAAPVQHPEGTPKKQEVKIKGETVKSPLNGIMYRAPSPASPAFVSEGETVNAGKTLCIVEAMKVMNEIKAEYGMKILKILVENGKSVVSAQDMFIVEKL